MRGMLSRRACLAGLGSGLMGAEAFRYRVVPGWGVLDEKTPVKN